MSALPEPGPWFVYLVRCADGTLYAGITTDINRRVAEHNSGGGLGARYTRGRGPVTLAYFEPAIADAHAPAAARAPPAGRPPNRPLTMIDGLIAHDARQAARTDR